MLVEINVRNLAIIDELGVGFDAGMTVLSGETGAGKSILVDALGLVLGDRAGADAIRDGCDQASVNARFGLDDAPYALAWLREHDLIEADDDEAVVRRVIARTGRSRCWINNTPVAARDLRTLGAMLVDILGQHAHQRLLQATTQRALVDEYGGHDEALQKVAATAERIETLRAAIDRIEQIDDSGEMRRDLLRYQVDELDAVDVGAAELDDLEAEHRRLASAERLIADGQHAHATLSGDDETGGAVSRLADVEKHVQALSEIDAEFAETAELVTGARIQAEEAADGLRRHIDALELDPARLQQVEARLATLNDLARKHRCRVDELPALADRLREELAELDNADQRLNELRDEEAEALADYQTRAQTLTEAREIAAGQLAAGITESIRSLGMPQADFDIRLTRDEAPARVSRHGLDAVVFHVAANPGQAARTIDRVASGGELSRLSLAIEVITASRNRIPTLVFDEVDTGIGGGVAEIVGRQLRALGDSGQALCVTHLPQVAVQACRHLCVTKQVDGEQTTTAIEALDADARVEEIARMLGGMELTQQTRDHAADMLARAQ